MLTLGIDIHAEAVNALASDVVVGPPGPVACSLFVRALLREAYHGEEPSDCAVKSVAIGIVKWEIEGRKGYNGSLKWTPRRHTYDPVTHKSAVAIMDGPVGRIHVKLAVSLECDSAIGERLVQSLNEVLPAMKFAGGTLNPTGCTASLHPTQKSALRRAYLMMDRTQRIHELAEQFAIDPMDVLLDIAHRAPPDDSEPVTEYQQALMDLGFVSAVPIGYRLVTELSTERTGRRRDMPHAFAETVTGLAEYSPVGRLEESVIRGNAWKSTSTPEIIYLMERSHV